MAEATLTELKLQDDISESNKEFHETLSRLSAASRGIETARVTEWVDKSPQVITDNTQLGNESFCPFC